MPIEIEVGSLLLRAGLQGPDTFLIHTTSYSAQWDVVVGQDGFALERTLRAAGWHLMYLAGAVSAIAFGRSEGKNARLAVDRVLAQIRKLAFNAAEVVEISTRHFLGIPYLSVSANARHLQQGNTLQDRVVRRQAQHDLDWARD